jgi:ketosteroid isomerase-like protein
MPSTDVSDRRSVATDLLTAIAERRRDDLPALLTDDVTWWVPLSAAARGLPRPLQGKDGVLGLLGGDNSHYRTGTMRWEFHDVLQDADRVVVHCTLRALTRDGVEYENHYLMLYRFAGDQVAEAWEYTDTAYAFGRFDLPAGP